MQRHTYINVCTPGWKLLKWIHPNRKKRIGNLWPIKVVPFLYISVFIWYIVPCISLFCFRVGSTYYWVDCTLGNSRIIGSRKECDPKKLMQANHDILLWNILSKKVDFQFQYFGIWSVLGTHIFHVRFRGYSPSLLRHLCLSFVYICNCSAISWHFLFRPDGIKTLIYNKNYSVSPSYTTIIMWFCNLDGLQWRIDFWISYTKEKIPFWWYGKFFQNKLAVTINSVIIFMSY